MLRFDGSSFGNPGPAGAGAVLYSVDGSNEVEAWAAYNPISWATNNEAEFGALLGFLGTVGSVLLEAKPIDSKVRNVDFLNRVVSINSFKYFWAHSETQHNFLFPRPTKMTMENVQEKRPRKTTRKTLEKS